MDHYAAGTDGNVVADGDPRKDGNATANPTVVADGDGLCPFLPRVAFRRVGAVTGGVDADVRADEAVIADGDEGLVEDGEAEVGKEAFAHTDVLAVVAVEWLVDEGVFIGLSEYALQKGVAFLQQGGAHPVVLPAEVFHFVEFPDEFPVVGLIYEAGGHFFLFCHSAYRCRRLWSYGKGNEKACDGRQNEGWKQTLAPIFRFLRQMPKFFSGKRASVEQETFTFVFALIQKKRARESVY